MLHVARKRAALLGTTWQQELRAYSSLHRSSSARARAIRAMRWADIPEPLQELVSAFARGQIPDPCPRALHWGSRTDPPRGRMVPVRCTSSMVNVFYALAEVPHAR